ncbi:tRNA (adenosine(37)-N6)-threonylcarbamoyltransferase complex ATPase subunit type 1 TsaE [Fundidesulfovibrio butyratiphilus]
MDDEADLYLADESATLALGRALALALPPRWTSPCALLTGEMGSGKTCLTRGLAGALPGAENAQVASPSFNLVNVYPTHPIVAHVDLYRLEEGCFDACLEDVFDRPGAATPQLAVVEWAERLPQALKPAERLEIFWNLAPAGRRVTLRAFGDQARTWLASTLRTFKQSELP